jgi:predicted N-acetyltransferase YhbS
MTARPIRDDDLTAIAAFLADDEERLLGRPSRTGVEDVRAWTSGVDLSRDSWLYEQGDRTIRALGWVQPFDEVGVAVGVVHADARGRGLGSELVARAEARLSELSVARIQQIAFAADAAAAPLLLGRGYREVRRFWDMTIELDGAPAPPRLPEGVRIEPFSTADARAFHEALDEAFRDHWEHHSEPFEEWWARRRQAADFDPTLWFVVRHGGEVVAAVRNDPFRAGGAGSARSASGPPGADAVSAGHCSCSRSTSFTAAASAVSLSAWTRTTRQARRSSTRTSGWRSSSSRSSTRRS